LEVTREIKNRINRITGTRKITKAMEMVASSKIRKARSRIFEARPFIEKVEDFITDISFYSTVSDHLLNPHKDIKTVLVIGITADGGLCGGYNSNIIRLIEKTVNEIKNEGKEVELDIIGTRGKNYFRYVGIELKQVFENLSDHPKFLDAREIANMFISRYANEEIDKVIICYTKFINAAEHLPFVQQILPIPLKEKLKSEEKKEFGAGKVQIGDRACRIMPEFIYEPSSHEILKSLFPEYIYTIVYMALLESTASETGARMTAMKGASDNADEIIKDLTIQHHRVRQQQITIEIAEIISGAEALTGKWV